MYLYKCGRETSENNRSNAQANHYSLDQGFHSSYRELKDRQLLKFKAREPLIQ